MPQPSGQVLVDSGHALAGFFAYANDSGMWDAQAGAMLTKVGSGAVTVEGGANVATSNANTYYTLASAITLSGAFSVGFRCRQTASDSRSMVLGQHTTTTSYIWLNNSGSTRFGGLTIGTNGGTTSMTTWHITRDGTSQPIRLYKNGVLQATLANSGSGSLTVSALLKGYSTNTSFDFAGAVEWVHVLPAGKVLNQTEIDSLVADPYQILQAAAGIDADVAAAGAMAWAATGAIDVSGVVPIAADVAGSGAMAWAAAGSVSTSIASGAITLTAPAAYRMHQRSLVTNTASVAISGAYTGSPGSIQYRFAGGAWQTLVASPTGGAFSQSVTLPIGQGALEVRFSSDTGVTALRALVGVGDVYIVAGQSNNVGVSPQIVAPAASAFTAIQYDRADTWKPLQEGDTQAASFDGGSSGSKGSYFGALSNRLQANGVPVAFVPAAQGSTRISDWARNTGNPASTATLYGRALTQRNEIAGCRALIWWQGESDASNATDPSTYESATNALIDGWMTDTGTPTFLVKITNFHANAPTIRARQDAIAAGNANVIGIADGGGAYSGDVHYLTTAQINAVADAVYTPFVAAFYPDLSTVSVAGNATMSWAATGAASVTLIAPPVAVDAAGAAAMAWAATGAASATVIDPAATQVEVAASAAMVWAATGAASASILPPVAADVQGAASMAWAATGYVFTSDGSIVWPATRAGEANTARVPFDGVRVIVPDADDPAAPVKALPLYLADTERVLFDFEAKYLAGAGDTAATLLAVDAPAGLLAVPDLPVSSPLASGIVALAITPATTAGTYRLQVQIRTAGGRECTGLLDVVVSASAQPVKTFRLRSTADRDVFDLDYTAKYLEGAADTPASLLGVVADAGLTADARLDVGGVVQLAVDNPAAAGTYQVRAQLLTTAGRRKTGAIAVEVLP